MAVILWAMGLSLLIQGGLSSVGQTDRGCKKWTNKGTNVCCEECYPGNRLVEKCGPNPKDLCTPCEPGTFTENSQSYQCTRCTQCAGAQVFVKECTATTDTTCDCIKGLTCGDKRCSFCVKHCGKGKEPTESRSCRPCPDGTFNDQIHQKCKPWSTKCPNPDDVIEARADAFTDIKCRKNISATTVPNKPVPAPKDEEWAVFLFFIPTVAVMAFIIMIIIAVINLRKKDEKKQKEQETIKTPIIRTPTDDPRTLIAIECSFHEAQQEQGSSSESLASKDSSDLLIP